jgi:hypothetical protein
VDGISSGVKPFEATDDVQKILNSALSRLYIPISEYWFSNVSRYYY